jgi:bifunctional non-homologous end joining protein LigD
MTDPEREPALGLATAALEEYRSRRDFDRTAEPAGDETPSGPAARRPERPVFVVQKHDASRLHYDFRLEMGGVLKSWAIPKGPSLDPADKRLAVMTEDHPLEYAAFEGTIPEGEYGGGTVMLWDFGWWEPDLAWMQARKSGGAVAAAELAGSAGPIAMAEAALAKGDLKFVIHGQKLTGSWALVQMKGRGDKNWLLVKHRDESARPGADILQEAPDSVATGRSLEEIAADASAGAAASTAGASAVDPDAPDQAG